MRHSLQTRLSASLLLSLISVFLVMWVVLSNAIRYVAEDYIASRLQHDSEMLLAGVTIAADGTPTLDMSRIDTVYQRPFSGHYYGVTDGAVHIRSRSLWDHDLAVPTLQAGASRRIHLTGPQQQPLLLLVAGYAKRGHTVTIAVAEDLAPIEADIRTFQRRFAITAAIALLLLVGVQMLLVRTALRPLKRVRSEIRALEHGELRELTEAVPTEVAPLVGEVNRLIGVLDRRLKRSRNALGDLAHALKKPVTVLRQLEREEAVDDPTAFKQALAKQTRTMQELIDRVLRRARLAGAGPVGTPFAAATELPGLVDTLRSMHRQKRLAVETDVPTDLIAPMDREDMLELLGNLMDNACKWAKQRVRLTIRLDDRLSVQVEDDGPGAGAATLAELSQRGRRMDESVVGHGLGLAIVQDMVEQYHGTLELGRSSDLGGFRVRVVI